MFLNMDQIEITSGDLWPTPTVTVWAQDPQELNRALTSIIIVEEKRLLKKTKPTPVAGLEEGLTAHWLEYNVLNWRYREIDQFRNLVLTGIDRFLKLVGNSDDIGMQVVGISCWANVLRYGQSLTVHHHDPAFVSGHYTVQTGNETDEESQESGETIYFRPGFMDRSHGGKAALGGSPWDEDWRIVAKPAAGKLFLFPSYVRHEVRPYLGKTQRISIAMDVFIKKQELPIYFSGNRWFVPKEDSSLTKERMVSGAHT